MSPGAEAGFSERTLPPVEPLRPGLDFTFLAQSHSFTVLGEDECAVSRLRIQNHIGWEERSSFIIHPDLFLSVCKQYSIISLSPAVGVFPLQMQAGRLGVLLLILKDLSSSLSARFSSCILLIISFS